VPKYSAELSTKAGAGHGALQELFQLIWSWCFSVGLSQVINAVASRVGGEFVMSHPLKISCVILGESDECKLLSQFIMSKRLC